MAWEIFYLPEAVKDLENLDNSQVKPVLKAIEKVAQNPLPATEGGLGKPLGNNNASKLAGYLKIKLSRLGLRVVYSLKREGQVMKIIVVSVRTDDIVYKLTEKRINK